MTEQAHEFSTKKQQLRNSQWGVFDLPDIPNEKCMVIWQILGSIFLRNKFRHNIRSFCCIRWRFGNF